MNRKILKSILCCGALGALVLTISACATAKNFAGFLGIVNTAAEQEMKLNISTFAKTIRPARGNSDSHYYLARYYQDRGNHREAVLEFEKTLAIDPGHAKAQNAMGVSYDFLKQFERAAACYQAALKLDPDSAIIYNNNIGQSLLLQGKYNLAIEAFKKAAASEKGFKYARIHNNLGRAYAMAGQDNLALAEFKQGSIGSESAKAVLDRVLREGKGEGQPAASKTVAVAAEGEAKAFADRVSKFLQERSVVADVRNETAALVPVQQKQPAPVVSAVSVVSAPTMSAVSVVSAPAICVEVLNGNGVKFAARNMGQYLNSKGYRVARVRDGIRVHQTYIYYEKGYAKEAKALARKMPVVAIIKEVSRLKTQMPEIKVKILLGKDMALRMKVNTLGA